MLNSTFSERDEEHLSPQWTEGKAAFGRGQKLDDCPYEYGTDEYHCWRQGWEEGLAAEFK